jgi:hypothetical protein
MLNLSRPTTCHESQSQETVLAAPYTSSVRRPVSCAISTAAFAELESHEMRLRWRRVTGVLATPILRTVLSLILWIARRKGTPRDARGLTWLAWRAIEGGRLTSGRIFAEIAIAADGSYPHGYPTSKLRWAHASAVWRWLQAMRPFCSRQGICSGVRTLQPKRRHIIVAPWRSTAKKSSRALGACGRNWGAGQAQRRGHAA